ncbi:hypothetical protein LCGC14_1686270 [marine sediment metagenome]|uniref:BppU N-terminal domain-containing protein n=1 Tax=marine sediment metagenome TaxID=412755 RepID=A0A0F9K2Q0_9ZZZZ
MSEPIPKIEEPWTAGDTGPPLPFDDDGSLVGFTVRLIMIRPSPSAVLTKSVTESPTADGQITDAANGIGQFTFIAADLVAGLNQECALEFVDTGGSGVAEHTDRFLIDVKARPEDGA